MGKIKRKTFKKKNIKNLDELRESIIDIWSKFPICLCEKLCAQFDDKIKYLKEIGGKRINKDLMIKLMKEKNDNNTIFIPLNNDNEWVSVKRDINYRLVYKDKIVKKIKYKFVKQIQKQKNSN